MRLEAVELIRVPMPLVRSFRTSFGVQHTRDVLLVRAITDAGDGWGECAAHAEPYYNEEFVDASDLVLRRWLAPALLRETHITAEEVSVVGRRVKGYPAAKAAIEMAVLDAQLRAAQMSLTVYLGGVRDAVPVGVSVGITDSVSELVDVVGGYVDDGYQRVKLKIEPGWDLDPVRAVRREFPNLPLQVDANAAYPATESDAFVALDDQGLLMIEQPFGAEELEGHRLLAGRIRTPICLDESIFSARSAAAALDAGACTIVNIKVGRVGGILEARRIHDLCAARGVPVWCGGMLESGVGRAANVAIASLPGFAFPGDISASDRYFRRDVTRPFRLIGSTLAVPSDPGLGVSVDSCVLAELGARRDLVSRRP